MHAYIHTCTHTHTHTHTHTQAHTHTSVHTRTHTTHCTLIIAPWQPEHQGPLPTLIERHTPLAVVAWYHSREPSLCCRRQPQKMPLTTDRNCGPSCPSMFRSAKAEGEQIRLEQMFWRSIKMCTQLDFPSLRLLLFDLPCFLQRTYERAHTQSHTHTHTHAHTHAHTYTHTHTHTHTHKHLILYTSFTLPVIWKRPYPITRAGQNHYIYTVYIRYFWQENHQI